MVYISYLRLILPLLFVVCYCEGKTAVPVLMWGDTRFNSEAPRGPALQYIESQVFEAQYLKWYKPQNVLLFIQDALSVEDLSSHVREMSHIGKKMDQKNSMFLPNVINPDHIIHSLPKHGYNVITLKPGSSVAGLKLKDGKNLVIVQLPSTLTNPSRRRALQKADEVVDSVLSKIGRLADFTVVFTAKQPSVDMQKIRITRSLQQKIGEDEEIPSGFYKSKCVLLYLRNDINVTIGSQSAKLPSIEPARVTADCQAVNTIHIPYTGIQVGSTEYSKLTVTLGYKKEANYYALSEAELVLQEEASGLPEKLPLEMKTEEDWVPIGMSYACSKRILFSDGSHTIYLNGIQTQAHEEEQLEKFGNSWDCVGFFSVPIWCGLLASLLSTIILLWGLYMLAQVRTMDCFDDPKGKTIMVPTSD